MIYLRDRIQAAIYDRIQEVGPGDARRTVQEAKEDLVRILGDYYTWDVSYLQNGH